MAPPCLDQRIRAPVSGRLISSIQLPAAGQTCSSASSSKHAPPQSMCCLWCRSLPASQLPQVRAYAPTEPVSDLRRGTRRRCRACSADHLSNHTSAVRKRRGDMHATNGDTSVVSSSYCRLSGVGTAMLQQTELLIQPNFQLELKALPTLIRVVDECQFIRRYPTSRPRLPP